MTNMVMIDGAHPTDEGSAMWTVPLNPTNPRHQALVLIGAGILSIVMMLIVDVALPALVAVQIGGAP